MKVIQIFGLNEWEEADDTNEYGEEEEQIGGGLEVLCGVPLGQLFIHAIQQVIIRCLLCTSHCFRHWGYKIEQHRQILLSVACMER